MKFKILDCGRTLDTDKYIYIYGHTVGGTWFIMHDKDFRSRDRGMWRESCHRFRISSIHFQYLPDGTSYVVKVHVGHDHDIHNPVLGDDVIWDTSPARVRARVAALYPD